MAPSSQFLKMIPENIPAELIATPRWLVWIGRPRDGKITKIPKQAKNGRNAKVNQPSHCCDFETAWTACNKGAYDGLGFVLFESDPFTAIDIDKISDGPIDPAGIINDVPVIKQLDSYTEISPSGKGLRIFVKGKLPPGGRRVGNFELYDSGRYVTVTGHHVPGTPLTVEDRQAALEAVHAEMFKMSERQNKAEAAPGRPPAAGLDDSAVMDKMLASSSGPRIAQLMAGDFTGYPSQSEADSALCCHLAFWFQKNALKIDQIFRGLGLFRPKWDRKHHADGRTYGQATIERAIAQCNEVFTPRTSGGSKPGETGKQLSDEDFLEEYEKISDPDPEQIKRAKAAVVNVRMNPTFATVMIDGKWAVLYEHTNPTTGRHDISYLRKQDFQNKFENRTIITGYKKEGPIYTSWAQVWLKSTSRREYDGIVFDTTKNPPAGFFNLYKPCCPKPGPCSCDLYLEHGLNIICSGVKEHFEWLMDWMAWTYQNLGNNRPGTAVVLRGSQGTGKGSFVLPYGQLFGSHFLHITTQSQFTGRFTEHLKNAILVFVDEALWAGDRKSEGQLKGWITEPLIMVEGKFINPYVVKNHINLFFASNSSWIIPAGLEERRFFALHVSGDRQRDYAYFKQIKDQMANGGTADLARFLKCRKITHNLREAPRTDEFLSQVLETMDPEQSFWFQALREECLPDPHNTSEIPNAWPTIISRRGLYDLYRRYAERINLHSRWLTDAQFGRRIKAIAPIVDGPRASNHDDRVVFKERLQTYRLPPLAVARQRFESLIKFKIDWDSEDELPF